MSFPALWSHDHIQALGSRFTLMTGYNTPQSCEHILRCSLTNSNFSASFWQKKLPFRKIGLHLQLPDWLNDHVIQSYDHMIYLTTTVKLGLVMGVPWFTTDWNYSSNCSCKWRATYISNVDFHVVLEHGSIQVLYGTALPILRPKVTALSQLYISVQIFSNKKNNAMELLAETITGRKRYGGRCQQATSGTETCIVAGFFF